MRTAMSGSESPGERLWGGPPTGVGRRGDGRWPRRPRSPAAARSLGWGPALDRGPVEDSRKGLPSGHRSSNSVIDHRRGSSASLVATERTNGANGPCPAKVKVPEHFVVLLLERRRPQRQGCGTPLMPPTRSPTGSARAAPLPPGGRTRTGRRVDECGLGLLRLRIASGAPRSRAGTY